MKKNCYLIFLYLVLDLISFTTILPLIPSIFDYYEKNDQTGVYKFFVDKINFAQNLLNTPSNFNKVLIGGLIGSWFSFLQYISSPIIGSISDIYGRKKSFLFTMFGISFSYLLWCLSNNSFLMFLLFRSVAGISRGNVGLSTAAMADILEPSERGKGMALIGIAFSFGFILGPCFGGFFASYLKQSSNFLIIPQFFCLFLSILNIIIFSIYFEETLPKEKRCKTLKKGFQRAFDFVNPFSVFSFRVVQKLKDEDLKFLKKLGKIYFLFLFFYSGLEYTLTFLTHINLNYTSMQQGKMYFFSGILMTFIQGFFVRKFQNNQGLSISLIGIFFAIPSFIIMGFAQSTEQLYISLALYSIPSATVIPSLTTLASNNCPDFQKGTVLGILRSLGSLARSLGPIFSSFIFWKFGSLFCYLVGGLLILLPLKMAFSLKKNKLKIK